MWFGAGMPDSLTLRTSDTRSGGTEAGRRAARRGERTWVGVTFFDLPDMHEPSERQSQVQSMRTAAMLAWKPIASPLLRRRLVRTLPRDSRRNTAARFTAGPLAAWAR